MSLYWWLLAAIAAIAAMALSAVKSALQSLLQEEIKQSCRPFANWILKRAVRLLPPEHQVRYLAEWRAELDALGGRKLTAVLCALSIRCSASRTRRELLGTSSAYPGGVACFSVGVSLIGILVGIWWAVTGGGQAADTIDGWFLLLFLLSILHDSHPLPILDRVAKLDLGSGSLFDYALLLGWAPGVSVPAILVGGLLSHMIRHRQERPALGKALFNAGQLALSASAAAWIVKELGAAQPIEWGQPVAVIGGMVAYSLTNTILMRIAVALDRTSANFRALWSGWLMDAAEWILLAGLASASALAVRTPPAIGLVVVFSAVYSRVMARLNDLVRPHIQLPQ